MLSEGPEVVEELRLVELSPRGSGAVSVLRLQGIGAARCAAELCGHPLEVGNLRLARLRVAGDDLDEALVIAHSATSIELHVHASPPLVARLFAELGLTREERTPRTFEERAAELLRSAPSEAAARILLDQSEGALRARLEGWGALEDDPLAREVEQLSEASRVARYALEPARVLLAGPVNAGKSTLFNALVGTERVITSATSGTTRDLVVQRVDLAGWPVDLIDSAGERELGAFDDAAGIEREGQRLAQLAREGSDIVFWLRQPGDRSRAALDTDVELETKRDLPGASDEAVSASSQPQLAAQHVAARFRQVLDLPELAWEAGRGVLFDAEARAWLDGLVGLGPAEVRAAAAEFCTGSGA